MTAFLFFTIVPTILILLVFQGEERDNALGAFWFCVAIFFAVCGAIALIATIL
jgi:hypothetical protein